MRLAKRGKLTGDVTAELTPKLRAKMHEELLRSKEHNAQEIDQLVARGWPRADAEITICILETFPNQVTCSAEPHFTLPLLITPAFTAHRLMSPRFHPRWLTIYTLDTLLPGQLAEALRARDPKFAATTFALHEAISAAAVRQNDVAVDVADAAKVPRPCNHLFGCPSAFPRHHLHCSYCFPVSGAPEALHEPALALWHEPGQWRPPLEQVQYLPRTTPAFTFS